MAFLRDTKQGLCPGGGTLVTVGMNRTDRLVAMVMFLQGRRVVRAEELAEHFEISVRTVYRDVGALSEAGVPVAGEAGVGYSLVKGYHLPPVMFTAEEAMALAVGEDLVKQFTDRSLATPMASALLKIRSVLPRDSQDDLDRLAKSTAIEGRARMPPELDRRLMLPLQQAIVGRRVVRMRYCARGSEETARELEPLGVVRYAEAWYLVAWCRLRTDFRHFKLERIRELEILPERFTPRPGFSLREHLDEGMAKDKWLSARVWFSDLALDRARRESFVGLTDEKRLRGGAEVTMQTHSYEWLARWLLSFGDRAEAVSPPELRREVVTQAQAIAVRYGEKTS